MNFRLMFANALARRLAYVLVASLVGMLGYCAKASAQQSSRADAYAACVQQGPSYWPSAGEKFTSCILSPSNQNPRAYTSKGTYYGSDGGIRGTWSFLECPSSAPWDETQHKCVPEKVCKAGDTVTWGGLNYVSGTTDCQSGCEMVYSASDASGMTTGTKSGSKCDPPNYPCPNGSNQIFKPLVSSTESAYACQPQTCPPGQHKVNGVCKDINQCPAGQHVNERGECENDGDTCPAGQTKAPDGSCTNNACPSGQARGKDGTCKTDSDGDGTPDGEGDGEGEGDGDGNSKFSGGDSCDSPPSCSGDAIQCGQARIQWRIDCNTRKDQIVSGGACSSPPQCVGKGCGAVEVAQLMQQWRTACAIEKLTLAPVANNSDVIANDKAMKQAEVNALRGMSTDDGHGDVDASKIWASEDGTGGVGSGFNPNLFGGSGGGQCATGWELMGNEIKLPASFWTLAQMIGWLVVAAATIHMVGKIGD